MEEGTLRWIDEREVSRITGFALPTLRNHRSQHKGIPFTRAGGRTIRYELSAVIAYMRRGEVIPQ